MSMSSAQGPRPPASTTLPAFAQAAGKVASTPAAPASGNVPAQLPTVDPVRSRDDVVSLSSQSIQARGNDLAISTSDSAQSFVSKIAKTMFGEVAETASVAYNLGSLKSAVGAPNAASENVKQATLDLREDASFIGTGQIATGDGRSFDFEVAVKYKAAAEDKPLASKQRIEMPDVLVLTGKPLPAIEFPGSLNDLFKLLSRELRTDVANGENGGNMTLRLQRLVDSAALLAPRARPDDPDASAAERAKAVASTYGAGTVGGSAGGPAAA
jgi:hypothetical protein